MGENNGKSHKRLQPTQFDQNCLPNQCFYISYMHNSLSNLCMFIIFKINRQRDLVVATQNNFFSPPPLQQHFASFPPTLLLILVWSLSKLLFMNTSNTWQLRVGATAARVVFHSTNCSPPPPYSSTTPGPSASQHHFNHHRWIYSPVTVAMQL